MNKMFRLIAMMSLNMLIFAGLASAHVGIYPNEVTQGSYGLFGLGFVVGFFAKKQESVESP